jgi:hypothetical protein
MCRRKYEYSVFSGRKYIMQISLFWACIALIIGTNDLYGRV